MQWVFYLENKLKWNKIKQPSTIFINLFARETDLQVNLLLRLTLKGQEQECQWTPVNEYFKMLDGDVSKGFPLDKTFLRTSFSFAGKKPIYIYHFLSNLWLN